MKQTNKANYSRVRAALPASRNPERTKARILEAAFHEFAAEGFAGGRVDRIAHRASINKRMLYHYFGDKEALFREVLRRKMHQRQAWWNATPDDPRESLPYWFELARKDRDWIRLLEWEALQSGEGRLIDMEQRLKAAREGVRRIVRRQSGGHLSAEFDPARMLLAMVALTWFPIAFPQLTRLITGKSASDPAFVREQEDFLRRLAIVFRSKTSRIKSELNHQNNGRLKIRRK